VLLYSRFCEAGMPGRTLKTGLRDWSSAIAQLVAARTKKDLAAAAVNMGYCVGRFKGSIRYRKRYL
jgi:hypothetical protein